MSLSVEQRTLGIDDLQLLLALAKAGSLAGAARQLKVNHASAWRRLGTMEARLGVRLFERGRGGYVATVAGEEAIATAERVVLELVELERKLAGRDVLLAGTVRLTTTETLIDFIAPALKALRTSHPGLLVEVVTTNALFSLSRRDADIALRPTRIPPDDLIARRLASMATALYATPAFMADKAGVDLLDLDWLAPDDSLAHLGSARWIAAHIDSERVVHRASSLAALRAAAGADLGVAPLPCFMGDLDDRLIRLSQPIAEMSTSLWLLTHPDLRHTPRIRVVLDALMERLAASRELMEGLCVPASDDKV